ncbi:hypothetical protein [Halovenus sp. HT40]|uniref:hypothetical protein n=1 Tax=Halovenus sp. HT40 TaxID=3126691 RepID=UPI00300E78F7
MYRRTVLGTLAVSFGVVLGGCARSSVDGTVASNETPLVFSHESATQATSAGVRIVIEVTIEHDGTEPITLEERVPRITCAFLNDSGETLYQSGRKLVDPIEVGDTTTMEFSLAVNVDDVTRYELRSKWADE